MPGLPLHTWLIRRGPALLVAGAVVLAGCGHDNKPASAGSGSSASAAVLGSIDDVQVVGDMASKPTITFAKPFAIAATARKILTQGTGAPITEGNKITMDYVALNGRDGSELGTTFGSHPDSFTVSASAVLPGLDTGLVGVPVGSRVLIAIPPADAYGSQGKSDAGVGATDSVLFVIDVKEIRTVLPQATGTPVAPVAGLPTVTVAPDGKPTIAIPATPPPAQLVSQPLITGTGAPVSTSQVVTVHYSGVIWATGKQFDSSWDRGTPADFTIGTGSVIPGWDESLLGQPVGSRLLLIIPPDKGYGGSGDPSGAISGTDTLVFVIDILDAA